MRALALLPLTLASPGLAQVAVVSPRPERVEVTVYRDPNRGSERPNLDWLNGYALISETRTIAIPAGLSELRFEGVASGIVPQSAIVGGIPDGLLERNRDAYLLSAGSLIDRSLGKRVTLRRTDRATGKVTLQDAELRSGSEGGVVLRTAAGIEALRCSGLPETLVYDRVPPGLAATPTLSVRVRAKAALTATVRLSYLASGFDWQADYVGILSADERRLHLQAWLTLASSDDTSFVGATTGAVAGRPNREEADVPPVEAPPIRLACWPGGSTSEIPTDPDQIYPAPPPPPASAVAYRSGPEEDIVVTGSSIRAQRERLGDFQLYRIPEPVTVAANAQKQIDLLDQPAVSVAPIYTFRLSPDSEEEEEAQLILRSENRPARGLGLPLPAGNVVLFRQGAARPLLIGEGTMADHAVGEKVELRVAAAPGVRARSEQDGEDEKRWSLTLTNDRPVAVAVEVDLTPDEEQTLTPATPLIRRDGRSLWITTVPANGRRQLCYRLRD